MTNIIIDDPYLTYLVCILRLCFYLAVFLVTFMALSCQGKKVPKVIKSLNKFLGVPAKSKVVLDILNIEGIDNEVEDVAAKVDFYHPNTTSTSTTSILNCNCNRYWNYNQ